MCVSLFLSVCLARTMGKIYGMHALLLQYSGGGGSGGAEESISLSKQEPTAAMAAMAGAGSVMYIGTTAK